MKITFLLLPILAPLVLATAGSAQTKQSQSHERYLACIAEARQWIEQGEYERAEKTARYAMSHATENGLNERLAMTVLGVALFRQHHWAEAADAFVTSFRPGDRGALDGMYVVACSKANRETNASDGLGRLIVKLVRAKPDDLAGFPSDGRGSLEACGWIIIAMNETGARGEADAQMAVKLAPESMTAWWVLGQRQMEAKKFKEAKISFAKVSEGKIEGLAKKARVKIKECDVALKAAEKHKDGGTYRSLQ